MPSLCFYFQVHQPYRLRRYSYFYKGHDHEYFDEARNKEILHRVAENCYLPTNRKLLELIARHGESFKVAFSITGVVLEQLQAWAPEVVESFIQLAETGQVEFLSETYHHSLACLFNHKEFKSQIKAHADLMHGLFNYKPCIFRNTELAYDDSIGALVSDLNFRGIIAEGPDDILGWRSPHFVYKVPYAETRLLLKCYRLSDDIAFRFSNRKWEHYPLTADKFAKWIHNAGNGCDTINLFMDYETFGEHQWKSTGIFEFLDYLPGAVLCDPGWSIKTPSEVLDSYPAREALSFPRLTSWADVDRDMSAWRGNRIQESALQQVYGLASEVYARNDAELTQLWRRLLISDHFYYMSTKWFADGDVHAYFNPFESPYEAFISYMNVLRDFREYYLGQTKSITFDSRPVAVANL